MKIEITPAELVEIIRDGIISGLKQSNLVPATLGGGSKSKSEGLTKLVADDARHVWATDRARNIAQALYGHEIETELSHPDHLRELESIIATFRPRAKKGPRVAR